jgi:AcrR family transcriptional regulator
MVRPQKYKPDQVLEAVTERFKIQGYRTTPIDQMLVVTQLSRSSLYNGFGNKEAFYLMVLERITLQMTHLYMNMAKENQLTLP